MKWIRLTNDDGRGTTMLVNTDEVRMFVDNPELGVTVYFSDVEYWRVKEGIDEIERLIYEPEVSE